MNLGQTILNTLIVSIPEETFICTMILILMGRNDLIDFSNWKENLINLMFKAVIPLAIFMNAFKYIFPNKANESAIINIFVIAFIMSRLCDFNTVKKYLKTLLYTFLGFLLFMMTEIITILILMYVVNIDPMTFNSSALLNFTLFIPERIFQLGILFIVIFKRNSLVMININKLMFNNVGLRVVMSFFALVDAIAMFITLKYIVFEKALKTLNLNYQIGISVTIMTLIILLMLSAWTVAVCIYSREKYIQKY